MCSFVSVYYTPVNEVLSEHRNQDVSDSQADAMLSEGVAARRRFQGIVGMFSVSAIIDNVSIVSFLSLSKESNDAAFPCLSSHPGLRAADLCTLYLPRMF